MDKEERSRVCPESSQFENVNYDTKLPETAEKLGPKTRKIMEDITEFVEIHVVLMLKTLYATIREEEKNLKSESRPSFDQSRRWLKDLISKNVQNGDTMRLFGPVGERPLHVCSLSAHRFGNTDFLGQGNYMKDGIINGMKRFLMGTKDDWDEVHVGYGKDYCALIANYAHLEPTTGWGENPPPFWSPLNSLYEKRRLSTLGLYEGETVAYPMIASGDETSLYWILEAEKRAVDAEKKKSTGAFQGRGTGSSEIPQRWSLDFRRNIIISRSEINEVLVLTAWFSGR
jgi:hypothetical protein